MSTRRGILAFTAGAFATQVALPSLAQAEPTPPGQHPRLNPHPDVELLVAIAEFEALEWEFLGLFDDGASTHIEDEEERGRRTALIVKAQQPYLDAICTLRATTLDGIRARMRCILLEDQELDPTADLESRFVNERLMAVLLRDLMPRSPEA